jgi:hypothetical protein
MSPASCKVKPLTHLRDPSRRTGSSCASDSSSARHSLRCCCPPRPNRPRHNTPALPIGSVHRRTPSQVLSVLRAFLSFPVINFPTCLATRVDLRCLSNRHCSAGHTRMRLAGGLFASRSGRYSSLNPA